ncbi:MAG: hypothetical protein PHQ74_01235 [Crocinitomicaceae bacterium]|nr:hypothetical protein [Crocinitomicaceae bacterium]
MDKKTINELIRRSLEKLAEKDNNIIKQKLPKLGKSTQKERLLNRELHETTLNHRLAFYLETELINKEIQNYYVDIEYNRNFSDTKRVKIDGVRIPVRPDILIHRRMNIENEENANLLIIEAKKNKTSKHDIDKVKAFINDSEYSYKFGLTISYAFNENEIKSILYYKSESNKILSEQINVKR